MIEVGIRWRVSQTQRLSIPRVLEHTNNHSSTVSIIASQMDGHFVRQFIKLCQSSRQRVVVIDSSNELVVSGGTRLQRFGLELGSVLDDLIDDLLCHFSISCPFTARDVPFWKNDVNTARRNHHLWAFQNLRIWQTGWRLIHGQQCVRVRARSTDDGIGSNQVFIIGLRVDDAHTLAPSLLVLQDLLDLHVVQDSSAIVDGSQGKGNVHPRVIKQTVVVNKSTNKTFWVQLWVFVQQTVLGHHVGKSQVLRTCKQVIQQAASIKVWHLPVFVNGNGNRKTVSQMRRVV
ncbi:hypothetical protein OGATHE_003802 [Ogataea polymorpha]|uniref:Uncharacterized protein n=1 Tax=Ogataea polymorpha TaxID=460523 RepID=A0A9P8P4A2_9ASCO|nr:hypothetical protein OGATHE_003802 [Ogataea polymorpha]